MIRVHHLEQSRSFRVLWLLEELELTYELVEYARDPVTRLAPPELERINALGKSPVIEDGELVVFESGAIIDHVIRRHGGGRLAPDPASADFDRYMIWLHYAEGSAMLPVIMNFSVTVRGGETPALRARIDGEMTRHRDFVAAALAGRAFIVGDSLTGADINLAMAAEWLDTQAPGSPSPVLQAWLARLKARPAYIAALARGGDPTFRLPERR